MNSRIPRQIARNTILVILHFYPRLRINDSKCRHFFLAALLRIPWLISLSKWCNIGLFSTIKVNGLCVCGGARRFRNAKHSKQHWGHLHFDSQGHYFKFVFLCNLLNSTKAGGAKQTVINFHFFYLRVWLWWWLLDHLRCISRNDLLR